MAGTGNHRGDGAARRSAPNLAHNDPYDRRPLHARAWRISHRVRTVVCVLLTVLLCAAGGLAAAAWGMYSHMSGRISDAAVETIGDGGRQQAIFDPSTGTPVDLLLLGQDTRDGAGNAAIGGDAPEDRDNHQSDTAMLVHVSADRSFIDVVSIPRDSIVDAPACETTDGTIPARSQVMFNSIFAVGYANGGDLASAANCSVTAVRSLTGVDVNQFVVLDFAGTASMIDAIGGLDICVPMDTKDDNTGLNLRKGRQRMDGATATQYARVRHGTGMDGSDIGRTARQQYIVKTLAREILSRDTLTNPTKVYNLADSALRYTRMSKGLADINTLAGLAFSLRSLDGSAIHSATVPTIPYPADPNRIQWADGADDLWGDLRNDEPLGTTAARAQGQDTGTKTEQPDGDATTADGTTGKTDGTTAGQDAGTGRDTPKQTTDPASGLVKRNDGTLIDPATGGIVDPASGLITDPATGSTIGLADKYLDNVVCPAK